MLMFYGAGKLSSLLGILFRIKAHEPIGVNPEPWKLSSVRWNPASGALRGTADREFFWIFSHRSAAGALHRGRRYSSYLVDRVVMILVSYLNNTVFKETSMSHGLWQTWWKTLMLSWRIPFIRSWN